MSNVETDMILFVITDYDQSKVNTVSVLGRM